MIKVIFRSEHSFERERVMRVECALRTIFPECEFRLCVRGKRFIISTDFILCWSETVSLVRSCEEIMMRGSSLCNFCYVSKVIFD